METEQKEMMCKYKKIICKIFGEQIRVIGESSAIGPMGQFQIRFFYEPTKIYVTLDADRGAFTFDLKDEAKDSLCINRRMISCTKSRMERTAG